MTVTTRTITIPNGEQIAYRERVGETAPLLFVHTNQSSASHWEVLFDRLPDTFYLIALDLRGCGDSSYQTPIDSIADLAADVEAVIRELGLDPCHLVGWSGGCSITMQLEANAPELVASQTFISPISTRGYPILPIDDDGNVSSQEPLRTREDLAADSLRVGPLIQAQESGNRAFILDYMETLVFNGELPDVFDVDPYVDDMIAQDGFLDFVYALTHFNISAVHNGVEDGTGDAKRLTAPTLILYGSEDQIILRTMIDQTLADLGTDAALVVLDGVGHAPALVAPTRVATEIEQFVSSSLAQ